MVFGHERDDASLGDAVDLDALLVAPRDQVVAPLHAAYEALALVQDARLAAAHEPTLHKHKLSTTQTSNQSRTFIS